MLAIRPYLLVLPLAVALSACGGSGSQSTAASRDQQVASSRATTNETDLMRAVNSPCEWYGAFDGSGDGAIDKYEYGSFRDAQFTRWDLDGRSGVSKAEFDRCVKDGSYTRLAGSFETFDRNSDGSLAADEFLDGASYAKLDVNRDGRLQPDGWNSAA
jgi:hypothetical protein